MGIKMSASCTIEDEYCSYGSSKDDLECALTKDGVTVENKWHKVEMSKYQAGLLAKWLTGALVDD